jgi:hypothetical protein
MSVYIYEEDAFDKMAKVERSDLWLRMQEDGRFGDYSFQSFLKVWNEKYKDLDKPYSFDWGITAGDAGAIYGDGGFNRYTVRIDGEIKMIQGLARSLEDIEKALELGFCMFP